MIRKGLGLSAISALVLAASCSDSRIIGDYSTPASDLGFEVPDSGAADVVAEAGLMAYCPSNKCPPGWTTCPNSRFPCDTNILADPTNCGACGVACPESTTRESFSCVEGACAMQCGRGTLDCDGLADTGCELFELNNLNCGACGNACAAGTGCLWQDPAMTKVGCGCPAGKIACGSCVDATDDDTHCGACGNGCDRTGGGRPAYSNMYYGCLESTCGNPKCENYYLDCDSNIENGCETPIVTDDNCGGCGNACPAGQHCNLNLQGVPECMCDGDLTLCSLGAQHGHPKGYCVDLSSDSLNCGFCGVSCGAQSTCDYGACVTRCPDGFADCNANEADRCEIDTRSDPRNCGGCGIVCDAVAGQACVAGKCVVEPCDQLDAGEETR